MALLLDDLLDVSRITRGVLAVKPAVVTLKDLFEGAIEAARPVIDAKVHTLEVDWPPETLQMHADPVRVTQIITNLLTNAAKYTAPNGTISLGYRIENGDLAIAIRDTGIGLPPDMLTKVFDMFTQVAPGKDHSDGGLGIGLALVKGLVELHGGRVEARSAGPAKGSEFIVTFPAAIMVPQRQPAPIARRR
jgi:signal transduction histidine kinase